MDGIRGFKMLAPLEDLEQRKGTGRRAYRVRERKHQLTCYDEDEFQAQTEQSECKEPGRTYRSPI